MTDTLDNVNEWLKQMELTSIRPDDYEENPRVIVNYSVGEYTFQVQIRASEKWINAKALVAFVKDIPAQERCNLYHKVLLTNWELNEVTFSADHDGDIWLETDMPTDSTKENFEIEFNSIPFGLTYFVDKIAPTVSFAVQDTNYHV